MSIKQRITDWRREVDIHDMSRQVLWLYGHGYRESARAIDAERMAAIRARSPQQIARLESRRGLRA